MEIFSVANIAIIAPTISASWALFVFAMKWWQERSQNKEKHFYDMMAMIDDTSRPIAGKMAAVYQLRYQQKKHKEFIVRFLTSQIGNIAGNNPANIKNLYNEMQKTIDYLNHH